jgi:hypothetical protein
MDPARGVIKLLGRRAVLNNIITCRSLRVTYKTGSGLDDWIY